MLASAILPFKFSEAKLLEDLKICEAFEFPRHFNTADYSGEWKSISLKSLDGDPNNIFAFSPCKKFVDTPLLSRCPYFKQVIDSFKCDKDSIRLLNLGPGSKIHEHVDMDLGYEDRVFRLHIPIKTNKDVLFYLDNSLVTMKVGSCWYGNFNLPHRVENNGKTDRIHLVIDCKRNEWTDDLFLKLGYDFTKENLPEVYSEETKKLIIAELKLQNTQAANELIKQLIGEEKRPI